MGWDRPDQELALALHELEREEEANRCIVCGGDSRVCQDPKNQHAHVVKVRRCFAGRAVNLALRSWENDTNFKTLVPLVYLDEGRVKN